MVLKRDSAIVFPQFVLLKASAGSGKTYALTQRFVQFLISEKIPHNRLRNILAITFSNNASKEMKKRILEWLKLLHFGDPDRMDQISKIVDLEKDAIREKAGLLVEEIIENFTDFQVRTIDSFMTTVFRASALDFGYYPDFEIVLDPDQILDYSFEIFLRDVKEGNPKALLAERIVKIIEEHQKGESAFFWDPSRVLIAEAKRMYGKLSSIPERPVIKDVTDSELQIKKNIRALVDEIEKKISEGRLERRENSSFLEILSLVRRGRFSGIIGKGLKNPPVKIPKKSSAELQDDYNWVLNKWEELGSSVRSFVFSYASSYLAPYLLFQDVLGKTVELVKREQGRLLLQDMNKMLGEYLGKDLVPDVYFRIGDVIFHFLIDEFQDTSPIQWYNLLPLIENSLAQGGSLFVVGDTKQAIYGFRDADYRIMSRMEEENPFPSCEHEVEELDANYRSFPEIVEFNEKVFKVIGPTKKEYAQALERCGLSRYIQHSRTGKRGSGYVEVEIFEKNDEDFHERKKIIEIVKESRDRGYRYRDIAILARRNEDVVRIASWLNEEDIPFVSYSSLDIRRRKIVGEIISLLKFLDSPPDDLSFSAFLLGDIFANVVSRFYPELSPEILHDFLFMNRNNPPLYKAFEKTYAEVWERFFQQLFRQAGYLPLYDLVAEITRIFMLFELAEDEEAVISKLLETIKEHEVQGFNSLKEFLSWASDREGTAGEWDIDIPEGTNAVRVMTVHKAKGLGFPVVIAIVYGERDRGFDYVIAREGGGARILKLNKEIIQCDEKYQALYEEERLQGTVDRLNSLYVQFTRAGEELYVIGVKGKNDRFPFDLLPVELYPPSTKPEREPRSEETPETFPLYHENRKVEFFHPSPEGSSLEERKRGEFVHRVLFYLDDAAGASEEALADAIARAKQATRFECCKEEIYQMVFPILHSPDLSGYFSRRPGRVVMKEQEICDSEGCLFRIDRLVVDPDRITVIDYKTGGEGGRAYEDEAQVRNYMDILKSIHPDRHIEGIIVYIEHGKLVRLC